MINMSVLNNIIIKYKTDSDMLFMIKDTLNSMSQYVYTITQEELLITVRKWNMDKDELLYELKRLDTLRRTYHNEVIHGVAFINRLCKLHNLNLFFDGDIEDRAAVGEVAFEYTEYAFRNRYNR